MTETKDNFSMILSDQWDDATTKIVGEIVIAFGQLEHVLWVSGKRGKKISMREWIALRNGGKPVRERCKNLKTQFTGMSMEEKLRKELIDTLDHIYELAGKRNEIVHSQWGVKKKDGQIVSRHRLWENQDAGIDIAVLTRLRDDVRQARDRLNRLTRGLMDNQ